jgi:hypothetical protein
MNRCLTIAIWVGAVLAAAVGYLVFLWDGPDLSAYEAEFTTPKRLTLPVQRVLTVELVGEPNETAGKAGSLLYGAYFSLLDNAAASMWPLPVMRARWPLPLETPRSQWIGRFALPVGPDTRLPPGSPEDGPKLENWCVQCTACDRLSPVGLTSHLCPPPTAQVVR